MATLLEKRQAYLQDLENERVQRQIEKHDKKEKYIRKIVKREDFNELLEQTLITRGLVKLQTGCMCGENGCVDHKNIETRLDDIIKEYRKKGIYVKSRWNGILFNLEDNRSSTDFLIKYNKTTDSFETSYR